MKRILALALALTLIFAAGCGAKETKPTPEPTVEPTATPEPTPDFMTELTYTVAEPTFFSVGDAADKTRSLAPGTYRVYLGQQSAGDTPASWRVYASDVKYDYLEDIPQDDLAGIVGGAERAELTITVLAGDYVYVDLVSAGSGSSAIGFQNTYRAP